MISKDLAYSGVLFDRRRGIDMLNCAKNGMFAEIELTVMRKSHTTPVVRLVKGLGEEINAVCPRRIYPSQSDTYTDEYALCLVSRYGGPFGYVNRIVAVTPVCPCYKEKK